MVPVTAVLLRIVSELPDLPYAAALIATAQWNPRPLTFFVVISVPDLDTCH